MEGVWRSGNEENEEEVRKEIEENGGGTSGKEECEKKGGQNSVEEGPSVGRGACGVAERQDDCLVKKVKNEQEAKGGKGDGEKERKGAGDEDGEVATKVEKPPE